MAHRGWTRDELILAMNLYCQLPFGRLHRGTPEIIALASAIRRTPSSVAMKLCNLASLDPAHHERGVKGLSSTSSADRQIWDEFHADWDSLILQSERLRSEYGLESNATQESDTPDEISVGATESKRYVKVRLAQRFFRRAVLASFDCRCCITGIKQAELLIASHIVPWRLSEIHRANPQNGLCLSRLHDGAFDQGLITLDEDFRLIISRELKENLSNEYAKASFSLYEGKQISMPGRFRPATQFLDFHRHEVFRG